MYKDMTQVQNGPMFAMRDANGYVCSKKKKITSNVLNPERGLIKEIPFELKLKLPST